MERPEGFRDPRDFVLKEFKHGHSHALFRGYPPQEDSDPSVPSTVMDVAFVGLRRLCCWKDIGGIDLRVAEKAERAVLRERFGDVEPHGRIFLLNTGSVEEYVVSAAVCWAEFRISDNAPSPLVARDMEYRAANPPVDGVTYTIQ